MSKRKDGADSDIVLSMGLHVAVKQAKMCDSRTSSRPLPTTVSALTFSRASLTALAAAAALLALPLIVPGLARASGVETGPQGIAVDSSGDVYVSDWARNTIDEITPRGVSIVAGIPEQYGPPTPGPATESTLDYPIGVAVSQAGDLYIVDSGNCVVEKVTGGTLSVVAGKVRQCGTPTPGPATSSMLASPIGVAVDSQGNLYIADQGTENGPNNVIEKVTPSGTLSIFAGELAASGAPTPGTATDSKLSYPQGVAVDGADNVYIADTLNGVVEKVNAEGILSIFAEIYSPQGVATDSAGNVYVADSGENRIEKIDTADQLSIIAGNGQAGEPTPGPATDSMLDLPNAAAVDSGGNLYISDQGNDLAEEVTPAGELSIIWNAADPIHGLTLAVSLAGSGSGTVTSSPSGIACPGTCSYAYEPNTQVALTATPASGSRFVGWEKTSGARFVGLQGGECSGAGSCQMFMSSDMAVTATFQRLPSLAVSLAGSGSGTVTSSPSGIACPGTCSYAYEPDTQVTLTATPMPGSTFAGWEGPGCSGIGACRVTTGSEAAVTATFERLPVLSASITSSGATTILKGLPPIETVFPPVPSSVPPLVQNARESATRWREGKQLSRISRRAKTPTGTTFSFSLNEQATVSFRFVQLPGTRGHSCFARAHGTRQDKSCKRIVTGGTLSFTGHDGTNSVIFAGRISHRNKLNPAAYELTITATNAAGQRSAPEHLHFTIMKA